jgi:hypothetical protein
MKDFLLRLRGVAGISLIWAAAWVVLFTILISILQLFLPPNREPGMVWLVAIVGWVGLVSGGIFGFLFSSSESGKPVRDLSLGRAMLLGMPSSAVYPLLTGRANQTLWTCLFGAIVAAALVAFARKAALQAVTHPNRMPDIFFACILAPVRDAVGPLKEPAK